MYSLRYFSIFYYEHNYYYKIYFVACASFIEVESGIYGRSMYEGEVWRGGNGAGEERCDWEV